MKISRRNGSIRIDFDPHEVGNAIFTLKQLYTQLKSDEAKQYLNEVIAELEYGVGIHYNS